MKIRRVVAGTGVDGKARVLSDGVAPRSAEFTTLPGHAASLLWATEAADTVGAGAAADRTPEARFAPAAGGTRLMMVSFPPDAVMMRADFDAAAFGAEAGRLVPGLAETFEPDHPGMHTTDSIDYDIVLEGEITLELDDGAQVLLRRHDVAVQQGNRHAWRNLGDKPATMLFVLVGAKRAGGRG
jgi:mannose-6-phosphate isomerase-like protein (cupin superfamily)